MAFKGLNRNKSIKAKPKSDQGMTEREVIATLNGEIARLNEKLLERFKEVNDVDKQRVHGLRLALIESATKVVTHQPDGLEQYGTYESAAAFLKSWYESDTREAEPVALPTPGAPYVQTTNEDRSVTVAPAE